MDSGIVARTFGVDFIYFDLIFLAVFIGFMIKKKYWIPIAWGLFGWVVYLICEVVIWVNIMGVRHYEGPVMTGLFFTWLAFSPGFVQFSYVAVMFEKRNKKEIVFWSILFIGGWTLIGVLSQLIPLDDRLIQISREMHEGVIPQRTIEAIMLGINILLAFILVKLKKIRINDALYIFLVGTLVEFALEFSMAMSGIRQAQGTWSLEMFLFNTLVEFNLGIMIMYVLWSPLKIKLYKEYYHPIKWSDFSHISTDFNVIAAICQNKAFDGRWMKESAKLYPQYQFMQDLAYYEKTYLEKPVPEQLKKEIAEYWT